MKFLVLLSLACLLSASLHAQSHSDSKTNPPLTEEEKTFLLEAADARMMDWQEGKTAVVRTSNPEIKAYGELMMKDQEVMFKEIERIASMKKVKLPVSLSEKKAEGLEDLKAEKGEDLDKKFIKMMIIDHKRDVKEFENAAKFKDNEISEFAAKYYNLIESHLRKAEELQDKL